MRFRLLGPLQVVHADNAVDIGPPKQRAVLAALLLAQGRVVSVDRLIDALWGDDAPGSATSSLQAYISNLRRALRDGSPASQVASPIIRQSPGYYLDLTPGDVDLAAFTAGCAAAGAAIEKGSWDEALAAGDAALALWRGPFLEDLQDQPWVAQDAARVTQLRAECLDHRITALLALGRVSAALAEVAQLRTIDPLADRGCWLQMLTLYRAGRVADALDVYNKHSRLLDLELGLQPAAEVRELQTAILRQAPELAAWPRTPEWTGAGAVVTPVLASSAPVPAVPVVDRGALVGREREIAAADTVLGDMGAGAVRWLVFAGPAGIGKTRLAEEVLTRSGADAVWVTCPDETSTPPWWPMRQLVRALGADADRVLEITPDADPDTARFRVYERIQSLIEQAPRPLAIVIDDLQWADSTSVSCLSYLVGALRDRPVLVVVTVRDGECPAQVARFLASVARGDRNRRLDVPALSSKDVATLANQVALEPFGHTEAATLAERTGGNPFFVSEYARLPRDERVGSEIPTVVKSVLDRRLANLDPAVIQVLRIAAVIGDAVGRDTFPVLARVSRLDVETLADYLDEAADERIVVAAHSGDAYAFAHGLLREHLVAGMPALRRQRLHARIAEVLERSTADDALTRRAQHLVAAQPIVPADKVVGACRLAAEQATARWSSDIAARWWQEALSAYDTLPEAERAEAERDALLVALLEALARAGRGQQVLDVVEAYLREALSTSRSATVGRVASALLRASGGWPWLAPGGDPRPLVSVLQRATSVADSDPGAGARVFGALAVGHCYHPDGGVAAGYLDRAEELAARSGDADVVADALMAWLITRSGVGEYSTDSMGRVDQLIALPHSRSSEDTVIAHSVATMAAMNLGDLELTEYHLQAGIAGSEELQLPVLRAQFRWMQAVLAVWRGDFAEARRQHDIAAHVHEQTELYEAGSGMLAVAILMWETGDGEALDVLETGGDNMVAVAQTAWPIARSRAGARDEATRRLNQWYLTAGNAPIWTALGYTVLLAHLAADFELREFAGDLLSALEPSAGRIAVIGQVGVAGPVTLAMARLYVLTGDRERALRCLADARELAERTGGVPSLLRCRLLACELESVGPARTAAALRIADEAARLGMVSVAEAARALA